MDRYLPFDDDEEFLCVDHGANAWACQECLSAEACFDDVEQYRALVNR